MASAKTIVRRVVPPLPAVNDHPILNRILLARGVTAAAELDYGLAQLIDPRQLKGIEQAIDLLTQAYVAQKRILIVGDFDADGATSTALAVRGLRALGFKQVDFLVPNRFEYGYGLTPEIVAVAQQYQPELLITVDNGISSVAGVEAANALGMQVLITDHHLPGDALPPAAAIVNPNQPGCDFPCKALAGVGVMFYVLIALRSHWRSCGLFAERSEPNLAEFLDLVALGTVADVVPLERNNRLLVAQGLKRLRAGYCCAGIKALLQVAGRSSDKITAMDLGFIIGPRLNAAGRLDDMSIGIQCLLTDNPAQALEYAQELDALNRERRSIEAGMQKESQVLLAQLESELNGQLPQGLCLYHPQWHQGVIGILASRIKDKLHRPVIIFAENAPGELKGSGRSIAGLHLRDALDEIAKRAPYLLKKFGGHAMAAGLSLEERYLPEFKHLFNEVVTAHIGPEGVAAAIISDGDLLGEDFSLDLADQLAASGPWGQAFAEPTFDGEFIVHQQRLLNDKHLKMAVSPVQSPEVLLDAIAFNVDAQPWSQHLQAKMRLAFKLTPNEFRGQRSVQLLDHHLWTSCNNV
ncbi:MAG TPA: single-stranded-DNA-specific exonuclease RecJ, partial [Marinagarivorans sp.]|nr:single-stranded-DNA-specific exonuclease RecJ [Marinagarivorans sp.]